MMSKSEPVIIEVAISNVGVQPNPNLPRTDAEICRDSLACFDPGAAIVHSHGEFQLRGEESAARYARSWRDLFARRPDALLCPTITPGGPDGDRLTHIPPLARRGLISLAVFDPGSVNLGADLEDGAP